MNYLRIIPAALIALSTFILVSCNGKAEGGAGGNTTSEGTQIYDQRPHQNDGSNSAANDSVTSPGSNSVDLQEGTTGTDANMQNQSNTHGYDTQRGDNGSGSGSGTTGSGTSVEGR